MNIYVFLNEIASEASLFYRDIGLLLNADKCLLIRKVKDRLTIDGVEIPFLSYSSDAFCFLGCWLGNVPKITEELNNLLMKLGSELDTISSFEIEKHIKFFILKICYSGKITHILRTTSPDISREFCRSFNYLRTKFFASLIDVNPELIRSHAFSSSNFGGINFTKSSILCQAAFFGGGKIFVFECCNRFPNDVNLLNFTSNNFLRDLQNALDFLPSEIWSKCFPDNVQEIPSTALVNLRFCVENIATKVNNNF
ncbi:hypothetical protein P9112_001004 [Eukaryota sp. TZLM1-RC]